MDAVLDAAEEAQEAAVGAGPEVKSSRPAAEPFSRQELKNISSAMQRASAKHLRNIAPHILRCPSASNTQRKSLRETLPVTETPGALDLEELEQRLTVLEDKLTAAISADADESAMLAIRQEMDRSLAPYRRKMSAGQLAQLERQYTQKRLFERFDVPRLSLFYLT